MKEINYDVLAIDLDGTTLRDDKSLSPRTIDALIRVQSCGVRLVIASGRPTSGIRHIAYDLRLAEANGFVMAFNGGEIWQWDESRIISSSFLPSEAVRIAYHTAREFGAEIMTYYKDYVVSEDTDNFYVRRSARSNRLRPVRTMDFLEVIRFPLVKCMIVAPAEVLDQLQPVAEERLEGLASSFRSEPFYLEIVPMGVDKGSGMATILRHLGKTPDRLVAIGDAPNDIPMIRYAGLGVAMGNAQEPVKAVADHITATNENDGVAEVVDQFFDI